MEDRKKIAREWSALKGQKLSKKVRLDQLKAQFGIPKNRLTKILKEDGAWWDSEERKARNSEEGMKRQQRALEIRAEREERERLEEMESTPLLPTFWKALVVMFVLSYVTYCTVLDNRKSDFEDCVENARNTNLNFGHC